MLLKFLILLYFKGMQCSFLLLCLEHHFIHNDMYYRQKQVSRRCMNKSRAQFNRRIEQLEKDLENERRRANRYKKRHQRALKKSAQPKLLTPRSKTRRLLRFMSVSTNVRKTLLFHNVIVHNLRRKYASLKSRGARKKFAEFVCYSYHSKIQDANTVSRCDRVFCKFWKMFKT